jgi:zinc transporter 1/2/3
MFQNECIGHLAYESTAAAIAMAAALITFLFDYIGTRLASRKTGHIHMSGSSDISPQISNPGTPDREKNGALASGGHGHECGHVDAAFAAEESWRVVLLEAGIIFHSYVPCF